MEETKTNELIINVTTAEIIIALLEDKRLVELTKEKSNKRFAVGDIYLAKVKKIMPGLNAAFINIGYERDAFLHYLDLGPQFISLKKFTNRGLNERGNSIPPDVSKRGEDINKNGKITEVLSVGQAILVQIAKEPISTKGPRLCSEISIAGRHLVLIPFSNKISISQKIKSSEEKNRLKRLMQSIVPRDYGVIVRTVAKNKSVAVLDVELRELINKWESSYKQLKHASFPSLIIGELDRTSTIIRDILNSTFNNIYVNNETFAEEVKSYIASIAPEKEKIVKLYKGRVPIFNHFGIDKQIKALFGKTVTIKHGAYLIIEHTEALHVIDVNSGNRSKKDNSQETNAAEVNIIAAEEIARQLRLRDMGGIIVVDFIDMHDAENKRKVFDKMKEAMATDRTKHTILPLSKFGLMQITRQRVRPEMHISTAETCPSCNGTGKVSPSILIIDEIDNNIRYIFNTLSDVKLTLKAHPFVISFLKKGIFTVRLKWFFKYKKYIHLASDEAYGMLEYHFFDGFEEEIIL